jgi:hypothetical protein
VEQIGLEQLFLKDKDHQASKKEERGHLLINIASHVSLSHSYCLFTLSKW